jgi:hypothetical protein
LVAENYLPVAHNHFMTALLQNREEIPQETRANVGVQAFNEAKLFFSTRW